MKPYHRAYYWSIKPWIEEGKRPSTAQEDRRRNIEWHGRTDSATVEPYEALTEIREKKRRPSKPKKRRSTEYHFTGSKFVIEFDVWDMLMAGQSHNTSWLSPFRSHSSMILHALPSEELRLMQRILNKEEHASEKCNPMVTRRCRLKNQTEKLFTSLWSGKRGNALFVDQHKCRHTGGARSPCFTCQVSVHFVTKGQKEDLKNVRLGFSQV